MRNAVHEAEARAVGEEQDDLAGPAWEELAAAADADAERYDRILTQMGLAESAAPDLALYGYCSNLDGSQLLELAEALRPGLLEASAAWAQLAQAARCLLSGGGGVRGPILQVLRAAVTGLLLLHGIPSAALEPWGGEGQGPEPLACAGVALAHVTLQSQMDDEILESEEEPMWTLSPPPGLIHYALCHGPIGVSNKAQPYPPTRYSADHLGWLTDQLMDRSLAYLKETELLRACMTPMGAVPSADQRMAPERAGPSLEELRRLAGAAHALHRCWTADPLGRKGRLASPLLPEPRGELQDSASLRPNLDLDVDLDRGRDDARLASRRGGGGEGSRERGGSCADDQSNNGRQEASHGDAERFPNCPKGPEPGAEAQAGPGPGPGPGPEPAWASTGAVATPPPAAPETPPPGHPRRCCLFDPLWSWAPRDTSGHNPPGGCSSSGGGVNGSGGGPDAPEPWEAELPWLAWLGRQGLVGQNDVPDAKLVTRVTVILTSVERRAHAFLRQAQAQAQGGPSGSPAARSALTSPGGGLSRLGEPAARAQEFVCHIHGEMRKQMRTSLSSRQDLAQTIVLLLQGQSLPGSPAEIAEQLVPGLLAAQPGTWGGLLLGWEVAAEEPVALQAARACRSSSSSGVGGVGGGGGGDAAGPGLAAQGGGTAAAAAVANPVATLARVMLPYCGAPQLHLLLCQALTFAQMGPSDGNARAIAESRARFEEMAAVVALQALESGAWERLRARVLVEAGGGGGRGRGPGLSPAAASPDLALALAKASAALQAGASAASRGAAAATASAPAAVADADATPPPPLPPPCYGPGLDPAETRAALLRLAQSSPVGGVQDLPIPRPPLQPQSLVLEGPEHATEVLAILENLTCRQWNGVEYLHPLAFFPEVLHSGTGGGSGGAAAASATAVCSNAGSKQRAAGAWDPKAVRVLIHDLQVGCLPMPNGRHSDKYPWAEMAAHTPKITPTSAMAKPRAAHLKDAKAALLDKGLGGMWVSGYGVVGALGALMLAAEVRQEMRQLGRDCCAMVVDVSCKDLDNAAQKQAEAQARRGSKAGASTSASAAPLDGSGAKPWAGLSALVGELASHLCTIRNVDILLRPYRALQDAGLKNPVAGFAAKFEDKLCIAELKLLGLLSPGPGGCGPLREGLQVQLWIMECVSGRPGELVLPDMTRHKRAGAGGAPLGAAAKRSGAKR
ncbi:hypothetical protein HYH03_007046 [Edaphochlamys debaryana]|uniref:Uncharacterized protein n=1 Tax=Edaphochlamys debaryana TaxID=47281 RepID=A0A836C0S0_9CHLO|nr:hypothetical protein HYH03_007046 [Edaphochlamys debaryana]|eukprot:KAG2494803.1 hypothetical protein HYH03_007046 [Edaphochlamys debaryana]